MSTFVLTAGLLQDKIDKVLEKHPKARAIGFHVPAPPSSLPQIQWNGEEPSLVYCPSPLAFRAQLVRSETADRPVVLLTDRSEEELGNDVLARLPKTALIRLNAWQALHERLGIDLIDPRLRSLPWLPEALLALPEDKLRPATRTLDADEVWGVLLKKLEIPGSPPDLRDVLEWTTAPERLAAFAALPPDARQDHAWRIVESAGTAAGAILRLAESGRGGEAVAAGLVLDGLMPEGELDAERTRAVARFEARLLDGLHLEPGTARAWAKVSGELVRRRLETGGEAAVDVWLAQTKALLETLGATGLAEDATWLPSGFERRAGRFAETLTAWLDRPDAAGLPELVRAAGRVRDHGLAGRRQGEVRAVTMMLRLARFLATRAGRTTAGSFAAAVAIYGREGSWTDLARAELADTPLAGAPAAARDRLLAAVESHREAESRRFAELLAQWSEAGGATEALVPMESVLDRVVAPLAAASPVLLLVLDGMSFAVFRELATDLERRGWDELRPQELRGSPAARLCAIGLLPTVTQVCRTSLLCGERLAGTAETEAKGFAGHAGLRQHGSPSRPPRLFHKGDLGGDGAGLADAVKQEVGPTAQRVVGIVLNVVDDQLPKGGQLLRRWEVSAVRYLEDLLQLAQAAGRAVVVTADHGHVIERQTELRRHQGGGARFRPVPPPPGEGEVVVKGPRVLLGDDAGWILAWSERLRYSTLQSGYHGGASPQEVVVPISVWVPFEVELQGWLPAPPDEPDWWQDEATIQLATAPTPAPAAPPKTRGRSAETPKAQGLLFDTASWLEDLFVSPVYLEQRGRAERQGLTDEQVASVLQALDGRGKMTLAALAFQLGMSPRRLQGLLAVIQRVLNVEGYPVLALDPADETVTFDRALLEKQFPRDKGPA
jgi:hypothetical protein